MPFHGISHGFDAEHDAAVLEDADGTCGFGDGDGDGPGSAGDFSGGPVSGAETFGERESIGGGAEMSTGGDGDAIGGDDEGAVDLCEFFDAFANAGIANDAFGAWVAAEWVVHLFGGQFHDFAMVTDDEESTDGFAFAAFAADFAGEVDDDAECFEGDFGFQPLQIAGGESGELFGEVNDGGGVADVFFEGGVDNDSDITGLEEFVSDGFEEDLGDLELSGLGFVLDADDVDVITFGGFENVFLVGGDDDAEGSIGRAEFGEFEWLFGDDDERGGLDVLGEPGSGQEEFMEVFGDFLSSHARSVCRGG